MKKIVLSVFVLLIIGLGIRCIAQEKTEDSFLPDGFDFSKLPSYTGEPYIEVNDNIPFFSDEITKSAENSFEYYGELDNFGRCTTTIASVGIDIMPTEERGKIGNIKPTGWIYDKYDFIDGKYLFNRCHLIGYQLTGENDNELNLITGTRYMNVDGMLPFENKISLYVNYYNNHVLYRVTPIFIDEEPLARGVLMEAVSIEDGGEGLQFCVFCYNVQPGVVIDYAMASSTLDESYVFPVNTNNGIESTPAPEVNKSDTEDYKYVLNTNTMKFHEKYCDSVKDMKEKNRCNSSLSREEIIAQGYTPCKRCNP